MSAPSSEPPAPKTPAELRRFGLQLAAIFLFFTAITAWRAHHPERVPLFGGIAGVVGLMALVAPAALGPLERFMVKLGERIGRVTTPIVLGGFYYLFLTPFGWMRRIFSGDPLNRRLGEPVGSHWIKRTDHTNAESFRQQF